MFEQLRWSPAPWIPVIAGALWLWIPGSTSGWGLLLVLPVGALLLTGGTSLLLWPGDRRVTQSVAFASALGSIIALLLIPGFGLGTGVLLAGLSCASLLVAGSAAVWREPFASDAPAPEPSLSLSAQVSLDEAILGIEQFFIHLPAGDDTTRLRRELTEATELMRDRGWLDEPDGYHQSPPPLSNPRIRDRASFGLEYEHLTFESLYEPYLEEPGHDRWLNYRATQTGHAYILRSHPDRPWLVCNNGYRTGSALIDTRVFARFRDEFDLNLLIPVLPLHGPRTVGRISGDGFLVGEVMDTIHAEAQAMWDIRRLLSWLRAEGASRVGTFGLSLGGYTTALLACLDDDLRCAIAGIPASDFTRLFWRHGPPLQLEYLDHMGVSQEDVSRVFRVVSPLALEPRVPVEHRLIFAGVSDRLVTSDQVLGLWKHWDEPRIAWYQGGHVTFMRHPQVQESINATLRGAGLIDPPETDG